jgi:DNA/RNA endonuclease YhcR with UshA esterase domain
MILKTRSMLAPTAAVTLLFAVSASLMAAPQLAPAAAQKEAGKDEARKKAKYKSQEESASKNARFATISATDKSVTEALKATDLENARKLTGKAATFTGTVTKVFAPKSNALVILNFAPDYRTAVTAVIRRNSFSTFPTLSSLEGKKVLVSGTVVNYQNRPEIELKNLSQIKIVK